MTAAAPGVTWDALASRWDTGADWNTPVARRLAELADIRPGSAVLDAGCGAGAAAFAAARMTGPDGLVIGIDSSAAMVARARSEAEAAGLRQVVFAVHDAAETPYGQGAFGTVVSSMVVRYLPNPAKALAGWRHMLREGGTIAFSWVVHEDPAWIPVFDAVDAYIPTECRWRAGRSRWHIGDAQALLPPDMPVRTVTELVTTTFADAQHFWSASWTAAPALAWAHIPAHLRGAARDAAAAALAGQQHPLERTRLVGYTIARLAQ
jgi:ubiquinone/menaquinone biosynthesis C-methylase UbiE